MFSNYLLVALRNHRKHPVYTAIKILSLTLGLICSILVLMHVQYTSSYDKHFDNWQKIYRLSASLTTDHRIGTNMIADGHFTMLQNDYGQIEMAVRVLPDNGLFATDDVRVRSSYLWVDPEFVQMFSLRFLEGDPSTRFDEPNTLLLSRTAAHRYFGDQSAVGRTLSWGNRIDMRVIGVFEDFPPNTHFSTDALISIQTGQAMSERFLNSGSWGGYGGLQAYVYIPDPEQAAYVQRDLPNYITRNVPEQQFNAVVVSRQLALELEPLANLYLSPKQGFGPPDNSRRYSMAGLILFAALIMLSSCINFSNLSLAQMQQRTKEIGVRKSLGARRSDLLAQFLTEAGVLTLLALLIAIPAVYLAVPVYTATTGTHFKFGSLWQSPYALLVIGALMLTGLLSGLIPALRMSRYQPTDALKSRDGGKAGRLARAALAVAQFSFAVMLIALAVVMGMQVRHLSEGDYGFNRGNLVVMNSFVGITDIAEINFEAMRDALIAHPAIENVAMAQATPPMDSGYNPWRRQSQPSEESVSRSHLGVDEHYVDLMQLQLLAGRNFSADFPADFEPIGQRDADQVYGALLTESGVRAFGFSSSDEAVGELLVLGNFTYRVVGVVNDYQMRGGLSDPGRALSVLRARSRPMAGLIVRIDPRQSEAALAHIDMVWMQHRPNAPVDRQFFETQFNQMIHEETNAINRAAQFASVVTILIAVLGLYALAFYSTNRRTKEIGIRKVLGASAFSINGLLIGDFIKPVLVAWVIGTAAAWYLTGFYLDQFSSRIGVPVLLYAGVGVLTIVLAVVAVAAQCYRTARADPVLALRE
jgi:putative ABC transport system permease protein